MCEENIKQGNLEEEDKNSGKVSIKQLTNGLMTSPFWKCRILSGISIFHVYRCSLIGLKMISCTPWQKFQSTVESVQIRLPITHFHVDKVFPNAYSVGILAPLLTFLTCEKEIREFFHLHKSQKIACGYSLCHRFFLFFSLFSRTFCLFSF
mgnify:FL=1